MLITLEQAKAHLRIDDADADDDLTLKVRAAEIMASEYIGREIYPDEVTLALAVLAGTAGPYPIVCNDLIRAAILLTLGHLWENREDNVVGAIVAELKVGAAQLLAPYRKGMGV